MRIISKQGREDIAVVYIAEGENDRFVEFVESLEPPIPREDKWVNIISTLYGCPVNCPICDAGNYYAGKLTAEDMLWQIDYLVQNRYPSRKSPLKSGKYSLPGWATLRSIRQYLTYLKHCRSDMTHPV